MGFLALIALLLVFYFAIKKHLFSSSIGVAQNTMTTPSPTEVPPTSFQQWRETAEGRSYANSLCPDRDDNGHPATYLLPSH